MSKPVSLSSEALDVYNDSGANLCINQPAVMASINNSKPADMQFPMNALDVHLPNGNNSLHALLTAVQKFV